MSLSGSPWDPRGLFEPFGVSTAHSRQNDEINEAGKGFGPTPRGSSGVLASLLISGRSQHSNYGVSKAWRRVGVCGPTPTPGRSDHELLYGWFLLAVVNPTVRSAKGEHHKFCPNSPSEQCRGICSQNPCKRGGGVGVLPPLFSARFAAGFAWWVFPLFLFVRYLKGRGRAFGMVLGGEKRKEGNGRPSRLMMAFKAPGGSNKKPGEPISDPISPQICPFLTPRKETEGCAWEK